MANEAVTVAVCVPAFDQHPLRPALAAEVHARPFESLPATVQVLHLATTGSSGDAERLHLAELFESAHVALPPDGANYASRDFGTWRLRWERHSEFSTYTIYRFGAFDRPFEPPMDSLLPPQWLETLPGWVLVATHLAIETRERGPDEIAELFEGQQLAGSRMLGGAAAGWTDFRLHGDTCGRILVRDLSMTAGQRGRLIQRLSEIETYRMMALLAFPLAREESPRLSQLDRGLSGIVAAMAVPGDADAGETDRTMLDRLTFLAAESEHVGAATAFRFAAARAYHAIVEQRIAELREDRIPGLQTIKEFMDRRLTPAMNTCESTAARHEALSRRLARAGDLLRTRVDIALEEKNRDLLKSMNRRAEIQLRLQETVEGLSVVAISYYLLGLVGYFAKGAKAAGLPINPDVAVMIGVPVVLGLVWRGVRKVREALVDDEAGH